MSHTPGPWKIDHMTRIGHNVFAMVGTQTAREFVETDWEANRRLIEAAPTLLEQAKAVICSMPFNGSYGAQEVLPFLRELEKLRQTIHRLEEP